PETLPAQEPVTEPEVHELLPRAQLFEDLDGSGDRFGLGQSVQLTGVHQGALAGGRGTRFRRVFLAGVEHSPYRQVEGAGEVEVALVVRGHGHDGSRAGVGQQILRGPTGNLFTVEGLT